MNFDEKLDRVITLALAEDIGDGDHSSNCSIPEDAIGKMQLIAKEDGIIAGLEVARKVFKKTNESSQLKEFMKDGDSIKKGDIIFDLWGPKRALLQGERVALNLMQRMSGIATKTNQLASLVSSTPVKLLDTRKTTPNLRFLEKQAVVLGGGHNHRMGLYDMIMLKDNHIDFAGGIAPAVEKAQNYLAKNHLNIPIEVETRNLDELTQVMGCSGIQRVMFDNYTVEETYKAVQLVNGKIETESSGGITEETILAYAQTGVEFISVGALTHSVKSLDMSLIVC